MSIKGHLQDLYRQFKAQTDNTDKSRTKQGISEKQQSLLRLLWKTYKAGKDCSILDMKVFFGKILGHHVADLRLLHSKDVSRIVKHYNRYLVPASSKQIQLARKIVDQESELSKICKRQVCDFNSLTRFDMKYITIYNPHYNFMDYLRKFNLRCEDEIISCKENYCYGKQVSSLGRDGYLYFLKFDHLMLLDYDNTSLVEILNKLDKIIDLYPHFVFRIYQTYNGFHVFLVSQEVDYHNLTVAKIMYLSGCDPWYICFAYKNGFKVRISPKKNRKEEPIRKWVGDYSGAGTCAFPHEKCQHWIDILDQYTEKHSEKKRG